MVDRDTLINAAREAGADQVFVKFLSVVDEDSSAYSRMEMLYNHKYKSVEEFPSSDFFSAIWNGDVKKAFRHMDVKNGEALKEMFPNHPANPKN